MDWFKNWFDSFYYHKLYRNRNTAEAATFMDNIIQFVSLPLSSSIMDLACGKGRHSIYLNKKGYHVVGVDLSLNSIQEAQKSANDSLEFYQMDMRKLTCHQTFDMVVNLFTSFGYFQNHSDNYAVLRGVHGILKPEGVFMIDFLNATKVINNLVPIEKKTVDEVDFSIHRFIEDQTVVKEIRVNDNGKTETYQERVEMLELKDFQQMFSETGFELLHTFGDYELNPFDSNESDRLILIAQKVN